MSRSLETLCEEVIGLGLDDDLLEWPPDLFLVTEVLLDRSEAYRFVVSPPPGRTWPPAREPSWAEAVATAAREWSPASGLVAAEWETLKKGAHTPVDEVGSGEAWPVVEALLTLHAVADEACAGIGATVVAGSGPGGGRRGRARELLVRTGSLARFSSRGLHVIPKVRTPPAGISLRSLSRYVCVPRGGVGVVWDKLPNPQPQPHPAAPADRRVHILLLPWPLTLQESDFVALEDSVRRREQEPYGFFRYEPAEPIDLDLLERTVAAAVGEAGSVEVVVLPEGSVPDNLLGDIEEVLGRRRVSTLVAGVREAADGNGQPANWVYLGVRVAGRWRRYRQTKHHRWSLDSSQIGQYHLEPALDPAVRWWEDMVVPKRSVRFLEFGEGVTMVSLICEDLARLDDVAELVRAVGPSLVVTPLLDGPQLSARWTARYASVLADDPGSAVVTLSCLGMVERSTPHGLPPSRVVALWKDPVRGLKEIELEEGAHGVLVTAAIDSTHRHTADSRMPSRDTADFYEVASRPIRATDTVEAAPPRKTPTGSPLDTIDLSILTAWAESIAADPSVVENAKPGAPWRAQFGIQEAEGQLATGLEALVAVAGGAFDGSDPHRLASRLLRAGGERAV